MATTSFYLEKPTAERESPIMLSISLNRGERYRISTGERILPQHWNPQKQMVKRSLPNSPELNGYLRLFAETAQRIVLAAKATREPLSNTILKKWVVKELKLEPVEMPATPQKPLFEEIYEVYFQYAKATQRINSLKKIISLRNHLKEFSNTLTEPLDFDKINFAFWDAFQAFLLQKKLQDSSIARMLRVLKSFMGYAVKHGYATLMDYRQFKHKESRENDLPALTEEDLTAIRALDLTAKVRLERVRDLFLFQCETSLRYSDAQVLRPVDVTKTLARNGREIHYISLEQIKTGGKITGAPLSAEALRIYHRYAEGKEPIESIFTPISNQKYNSYLKEVAQLAGLTRIVKDEKGLPVQLWTMVCTHTARRTFITLSVQRGWSIQQIQVFTGHKSLRELEGYIKRTTEHNLELVAGLF